MSLTPHTLPTGIYYMIYIFLIYNQDYNTYNIDRCRDKRMVSAKSAQREIQMVSPPNCWAVLEHLKLNLIICSLENQVKNHPKLTFAWGVNHSRSFSIETSFTGALTLTLDG